jgi:polysaccharide pyruvyl transferase WcaK-like protein
VRSNPSANTFGTLAEIGLRLPVVRILIDHSGYDMLNLGDVAMLQSCIARLRVQWPDAEIMVITHEPHRLAFYCPGTIAISMVSGIPFSRHLPRQARLASEQAWKLAAPYFCGRVGHGNIMSGQPGTAIAAVRAANLVVAGGGSYMTDTWWWHAAGVFSLLSLAQRLGKSTAMFGQGIGPMHMRVLRAQARAVLPRLTILGLRESQLSRSLALTLGVSPDAIAVTGDDALELTGDTGVAHGDALGLSVRVSGYAGVDLATAKALGKLTLETAGTLNAPIVALPVSRHAADAEILRALLGPVRPQAGPVVRDLKSPEALIASVARCRAIVTGSYHAAVFGLAQGIPAVCISGSSYYDAKFGGLRALFPDACTVLTPGRPSFPTCLNAAIGHAWSLPDATRIAAKDAAVRLRDVGRETYAQFRSQVDKTADTAAIDGQEGLVA